MKHNLKKIMVVWMAALLILVQSLQGVEVVRADDMDSSFEIVYHLDDSAPASITTTRIIYGTPASYLKISQLGFEKNRYKFTGWKVYREYDQSWCFTNGTETKWAKSRPEGYDYMLYGDGGTVSKTSPAGYKVHLYAQWKENSFTVKYYTDETSQASDQTTKVYIGEVTKTLTTAQLGFKKEKKAFKGWKCYRESDQKWYFTNGDNTVWSQTKPEGYDYCLYSDGTNMRYTAGAGDTIDLYAQWVDDYFTIKYYKDEASEPASQITKVTYGVDTPTLTADELGFAKENCAVTGWKVYRESDQCWLFTNGTDTKWAQAKPAGYDYKLYGNGYTVAKTALPGESIRFYAVWGVDYFTVYYHPSDKEQASIVCTKVKYGVDTHLKDVNELGFEKANQVFEGWKVYREYDQSWLFTNGAKTVWAKTKPAGYDYMLFDNKWTVAKTSQPSYAVQLYAQWRSVNISPTEFGANGKDGIDDTKAIQKALNYGMVAKTPVVIQIPEGTYYINDELRIYSNTKLELSSKTIIRRNDDSKTMLISGKIADKTIGGYDLIKNVVISGGIWDGNVTNLDANNYGKNLSNLFYLYHGSNITIQNTSLKNCCGDHFIEFAGVKNATVDQVKFDNFIKATSYTSDYAEAIQLDYTSEETSGSAYPYDNTVCKSIYIKNCKFTNVKSGIGTHHEEMETSDVHILSNTFVNMESSCLNLPHMSNVEVKNNIADKLESFVIANNTRDLVIDHNTISNANQNAFTFVDSTVFVQNNKISNVKKIGIRLSAKSSAQMISNDFNGINETAVSIDDSKFVATGNNITGTGKYGYWMQNIEKAEINNSVIKNTEDCGIIVIKSEGVVLNNNIISNSSKTPLYISASSANVTGNKIIPSTDKNNIYNTVRIVDKSVVEFNRNEISNAPISGISMQDSEANIKQNTIKNSEKYGIFGRSSKVCIENNTITGSKDKEIYIINDSNFDRKSEGQIKNNVLGDNWFKTPEEIVASDNRHVKPVKMSMPKVVSSTPQKMSISWQLRSDVTGYRVQYSTDSKFQSKVTTTRSYKNNVTSTSIAGLKENQKYYVRIQPYKQYETEVVYGDWSSVANVTVKQRPLATITGVNSKITKQYGSKAFALGAKTNKGVKLAFKSSNNSVANVNSAGKVTIKGTGLTTITISASGTNYRTAIKKITITVQPKTMTKPVVKAIGKQKIRISWKKSTQISGYQLQYSTYSNFKSTVTTKNISAKSTSATYGQCKKNKRYYVRMRGYRTSGKSRIYGSWSTVASIVVK